MTSVPLVSFCVPTYNRCRYLASLLESLLVQLADLPFSYELVIADNGSTDATAETIAASPPGAASSRISRRARSARPAGAPAPGG